MAEPIVVRQAKALTLALVLIAVAVAAAIVWWSGC